MEAQERPGSLRWSSPLPISDRRRSHRSSTDGLGLAAVGEPAGDGVPEPLQVVLNDGLRLVLIPREGFGWVVTGRQVVAGGDVEGLLGVSVTAPAEVDAFVERARRAGAEVVSAPQQQPCGYTATFSDPDGHLWSVAVEEAGPEVR